MPLIGSIDSQQAQQALDTLLHGVASSGAQVAILAITGVPVVDAQIANALIRAAQSIKLLGAQVTKT
jgi:rsbT co-antagonist protein RsbR